MTSPRPHSTQVTGPPWTPAIASPRTQVMTQVTTQVTTPAIASPRPHSTQVTGPPWTPAIASLRPQSLSPALGKLTHARNSLYATMKTHVKMLLTSQNATPVPKHKHGLPNLNNASRTRPSNSGLMRFTAGKPTPQKTSEFTLQTVASDATTIESS